MADVHPKEKRIYNMSQIKSKNTKPEILVRKYLFSEGLRFRLHGKNLPGKPDLILPKYNKVIFVNGCFWHGHKNCKYFVIPETRREWWSDKIHGTKKRDAEQVASLTKQRWGVISVWECDLKVNKRDRRLKKLIKEIKQII